MAWAFAPLPLQADKRLTGQEGKASGVARRLKTRSCVSAGYGYCGGFQRSANDLIGLYVTVKKWNPTLWLAWK